MAGSATKSVKLKRLFLKSYAGFGVIGHACKSCGIPRSTFEGWKRGDPEFAAALKLAEEDAVDSLESAALGRAYEGSDVLAIFLLKGARPEKYRDRWQGELTGKGSGPLQIEITQYHDEGDADAVDGN